MRRITDYSVSYHQRSVCCSVDPELEALVTIGKILGKCCGAPGFHTFSHR
jgi:hypothetical protein